MLSKLVFLFLILALFFMGTAWEIIYRVYAALVGQAG